MHAIVLIAHTTTLVLFLPGSDYASIVYSYSYKCSKSGRMSYILYHGFLLNYIAHYWLGCLQKWAGMLHIFTIFLPRYPLFSLSPHQAHVNIVAVQREQDEKKFPSFRSPAS